MKLKINTILVVFFVALFSVGFSSLTAQTTLSSDIDGSNTLTNVEDFENHVKDYLPLTLVNYVVENYQDFSRGEIKSLLAIANSKVGINRSDDLNRYYTQLETWVNTSVPASDRDVLVNGIRPQIPQNALSPNNQ